MGNEPGKPVVQDLTDMCIDLRMATKQIEKEASRAENKEAQERKKVAELLAKGKTEIAQIHAETSIREHKSAISLHRLAAQMDSVKGQLENAQRMTNVSATMQKCMPGLQTALGQMEKIGVSF